MSKVALPLAHLQRLSHLLAMSQEESLRKAGAWLSKELAECSSRCQLLRDLVNSLRREWEEFSTFSAQEEFHFRSQEQDLARLKESDWQVMREYLAYVPRQEENFFQVERREWFLRSPQDTLQAARRWASSHRRGPKKPLYETPADSALDADTSALVKDILKDWLNPE